MPAGERRRQFCDSLKDVIDPLRRRYWLLRHRDATSPWLLTYRQLFIVSSVDKFRYLGKCRSFEMDLGHVRPYGARYRVMPVAVRWTLSISLTNHVVAWTCENGKLV